MAHAAGEEEVGGGEGRGGHFEGDAEDPLLAPGVALEDVGEDSGGATAGLRHSRHVWKSKSRSRVKGQGSRVKGQGSTVVTSRSCRPSDLRSARARRLQQPG